MADKLKFELALKLARSLTTVGHPRFEEALFATAEDLVHWCQGAFVDGHIWSPEDQAQWLVTEVRENWREWTSTADMREVLIRKFSVKEMNPEHQVIELGPKPLIECQVCNDFGHVRGPSGWYEFCGCKSGEIEKLQHGETWLHVLNRDLANQIQKQRNEEARLERWRCQDFQNNAQRAGKQPITQADFDKLKDKPN